MRGIDIAWARPDVDGILKTGAKWVARYFSPDQTKNINSGEVNAYNAAGLGIVTVWEATANRSAQGFAAGAADAASAIIQRKTVGLPDNHVIYFAVDFDANWSDVKPYFDGICSVQDKSLVGIYGGYRIVEAAHSYGIPFLWQTTAWSNGLWSQYANIRQTGGTVLSGGADIDESESPDFGQYPRPEEIMTPADIQSIAAAVWAYGLVDPVDGKTVKSAGAFQRYHDFVSNAARDAILAKINTSAVGGGITVAQLQAIGKILDASK